MEYRGTIQGNRTEASRLGSQESDLVANAASREGAVEVRLYRNAKDGHDWAEIRLTQHVNGAGTSPDRVVYHGRIDGTSESIRQFPEPRYAVTVVHGESRSLFHVMDGHAPEDDQPAIVASFETRPEAESFAREIGRVAP